MSKLTKIIGITTLSAMFVATNVSFAASSQTQPESSNKTVVTATEETEKSELQDHDEDQTEVEETDGTDESEVESETEEKSETEEELDSEEESGSKEDSESKEDQAKEDAENAALVAEATVTEADAIKTVKATTGLTDQDVVSSNGLESENGTVVYVFKYMDKAGVEVEMKVDAKTGTVYTESDNDVEYEG